jgi:hypothetical protein
MITANITSASIPDGVFIEEPPIIYLLLRKRRHEVLRKDEHSHPGCGAGGDPAYPWKAMLIPGT